jgi:four helix bundle protein
MADAEFKRILIRRAYVYALEIIKLIDTLNKADFATQILVKQLLRSATSIGANIVEAQAAASKRDFINFLTHALKSANESKFWLGLLRDSGKANFKVNELLKETDELAKILGSSISTLKGKKRA